METGALCFSKYTQFGTSEASDAGRLRNVERGVWVSPPGRIFYQTAPKVSIFIQRQRDSGVTVAPSREWLTLNAATIQKMIRSFYSARKENITVDKFK